MLKKAAYKYKISEDFPPLIFILFFTKAINKMSRRSLGTDIYSPIHKNFSLDDSVSNADGSISEFYSGAYNTGFKKDNKKSLEPIKDEDLCEFQDEDPIGLFKTSDKKNNIYSPICSNFSLNDSVSNADGSISEFYSGALNTGFKKDNKKSLEPIKDEDICEFQEEESIGLFKTSVKKNNRCNSDLFSRKNTHLLFPTYKDSTSPPSPHKVFTTSPVDNAFPRNESTEKDKVAPKKSPRVKGTKNPEKQSKDRLVTKRSSKSKQVPDKFITVRRDSRRSNLSTEMLTPVSSDHGQSSKSKENNSVLLESSVDCSTQTDLTLTDLQILMNRVDLQSKADVKSGCTVRMTSEPLVDPVKQPTQIPANALEKLKDIIDDEFHDLRQILYLQQFSLGKSIYKNLEETENTNSGLKMVAESLNSIIGLLNEDRQFRNIVLSQRLNS